VHGSVLLLGTLVIAAGISAPATCAGAVLTITARGSDSASNLASSLMAVVPGRCIGAIPSRLLV